jgi:hypothetical protein
MACFTCDLAFPELSIEFPWDCPDCGTSLKIVRPLSKREAKRMRLNLAGQKLAHENPLLHFQSQENQKEPTK